MNPFGERTKTLLFAIYYLIFFLFAGWLVGHRDIGALWIPLMLFVAIPAGLATSLTWKILPEPAQRVLEIAIRFWPITVVVLLAVVGTIRVATQPPPVMVGENWKILESKKGQYLRVPLAEAPLECQKLGTEWRLLGSADIELPRPIPIGHRKQEFWLSDSVDSQGYISYFQISGSKNGKGLKRMMTNPQPNQMRAVLCLRGS